MSLRYTLQAIISELVLWAIILLLVLYVSVKLLPINRLLNWENGHTITLYFNDANQLTKGAPVHFMGTDVGYVTNVKAIGNLIQVKMKTHSQDLVIPPGSLFSVEFNGLAGAKTLEILPPPEGTSINPQDRYIKNKTIRLRDVTQTQMILAQALELSSENLAGALDHVQGQEVLIEKLSLFDQRSLEGSRTLVYIIELLQTKTNQAHTLVSETSLSINDFFDSLQGVSSIVSPASFKTRTLSAIGAVTMAANGLHQELVTLQKHQYANTLHLRILAIGQKTQAWSDSSQSRFPRLLKRLTGFNTVLAQLETRLSRLEGKTTPALWHTRLQQLEQHTGKWAQNTRRWDVPEGQN